MIKITVILSVMALLYTVIKYVTNIRLIITDTDRITFWSRIVGGFAIMVLIFVFWVFTDYKHTVICSNLILLTITICMVVVNSYWSTQYSDNEIKRRKQDKLMSAIKTSFDKSPLPYFIKKYDGEVFRTIYFNDAFKRLVLDTSRKTPEDYKNSSDFEQWDIDLARNYDAEDRGVFFGAANKIDYLSKVQFGKKRKALSWTKYKDHESDLLICFGNFDTI